MAATATSYNPTYRYGESNPIRVPWKSAVAVNVGDFVFEDETDSYTVKPAMSAPWQTAIADPSAAPTLAAAASPLGPGFGAGSGYVVKYTYLTADGVESGPSPASSALTLTAGQGINATGVTVPAGVVAVNWYVSNSTGGSLLLVATTAYGAGLTITGPPPSTAAAPPAANGLSALVLTQVYFAKRFLGIASQAFDGTNTSAYGIQDGSLRVDTMGIYDFTCAAATFNVGDLLTLAQDVGNNLTGQTVVLAGTAQQANLPNVAKIALARVVQAYTANTTTVRAQVLNSRYDSPIH